MSDDREFIKMIKDLGPGLEKLFHMRIRRLKIKPDNAILPKDLVQMTIELALKNSRKEGYINKYNIRTLLYLKAENIWYDHISGCKNRVDETLDRISETATKEPDPYQNLVTQNELEVIQRKMSPEMLEMYRLKIYGYNYAEISEKMNITEAGIKMRFSRSNNTSGKKNGNV
jgi:DNA-directed RNA polymerase specialized sigma24 family protein